MADFESIAAVEKSTSLGGTIKVGVGYLLFEDGSKNSATAFEIKDSDGEIVTQFALLQKSLEAMLEAIHELYSMFEEVEE